MSSVRSSETLADRLRSGPLPAQEATQICRALLSAIERANAQGKAYGSISAATIVLEEGRPLLPLPTSSSREPGDDDLLAVAAVLYESLGGRPWTAGTDPASADWSGIPRRLRRVLQRALSPARERRWPDAAAFQRALWVPRPRHAIWPAVLVIIFAVALIATLAFCKPLGLCWERQPAQPGQGQAH